MQEVPVLRFLAVGMSSEEKAYRLLCLRLGAKTSTSD